MEVIRIPQVSLVDATGRRIGVYTDDPDWWQQLKLKHHNTKMSHAPIAPPPQMAGGGALVSINEIPPVRQMTPIDNINTDSTSNLRSRLIKDVTAHDDERDMQIAVISKNSIAPVMNEEYQQRQCNVIGETPLHIAIMYDDLHTIKFLIEEKGFDVNQRSCGGKFVGGFNSKLTNNMIQQSKYEGLAYYGEYPLAFAACFASKEIYDYLVEQGADPNLQDTNGNTVLHVLVINNKIDMFQYAANHQKTKALMTIKNNQDLTPINLAAKLGRKDLFEKMLELRNIEFWRYSNITCSAYPLEGLDTVDSDGKIAWNAALSYIVNGKTEDHLDMLEIGVVARLLEDKWSTYAQKRFFQKLVISIIHLIFLSIAVYTRAEDSENLSKWPPGSANTWIRYIAELAVLIGCLANLFLQAQEIYAQGFLYYLKNLSGEPANVFYNIFCIFILIAVPFRFVTFSNHDNTVTARNVEDTFVILAIPCGWVHLLFYARVANVTGPFVVMIYKMVIGDILTFSSIYSLLLFGFSSGFYYLYKNCGEDISAMSNYPEALMISFQMTLGEFKTRLSEFDRIYYSAFTKVVFVTFMILMHILLLNMLIAMMGNTYHQIIKKSEKEWRRQWAQVVILLERSFSPQDLKNFQLKYCIKLPSKDPNNKNELGLMVIKKAPKTKAFQKNTCVRNWKKFCKTVMSLLKQDKLKAVDLLEQWANKDTKLVKAKKVKKEFDWKSFDSKQQKAAAKPIPVNQATNNNKSTNQGLKNTMTNSNSIGNNNSNQKNLTTTNSSNNINNQTVVSTNATSVKKPPVPPPPPEPVRYKIAATDQKTTKQKDSIGSINSVSSETTTTTSNSTVNSRENSNLAKNTTAATANNNNNNNKSQTTETAPVANKTDQATAKNSTSLITFSPSNSANEKTTPKENTDNTSKNTNIPNNPKINNITITPAVQKNENDKTNTNVKPTIVEKKNDTKPITVKMIDTANDSDIEHIELDKKSQPTPPQSVPSSSSSTSTKSTSVADQQLPPQAKKSTESDGGGGTGSNLLNQKFMLNKYMPTKKTFFPSLQTSKLYPSQKDPNSSTTYSSEYYDQFPKKISISPVRDYPKMDLSDLKRPMSSTNVAAPVVDPYMKREKLPKFSQKNLFFSSNDSKSLDENISISDGENPNPNPNPNTHNKNNNSASSSAKHTTLSDADESDKKNESYI